MSGVFVDRMCPDCKGEGCDNCQGTGSVGSFEEGASISLPEPSEFARALRKTRERRLISMSELAALLKCRVSRISDIELGLAEPTEKEREKLEAWINQSERAEVIYGGE